MDSYRQRQMTYIQPKQYCLQLYSCIHLLKPPLQGFSATLQPDCEISSYCGKNKVSRLRDLFNTRIVCAKGWDQVIFDWFVLSMRMQVILDSLFSRLGSAPTGGGKKGVFRDWTILLHVLKSEVFIRGGGVGKGGDLGPL